MADILSQPQCVNCVLNECKHFQENHEEDEDDDDDYGGMDSTFDFDDSDFDSDESCDRIYDLVKDSDIDSGGDERVATVVTVVEGKWHRDVSWWRHQ